MKYLNLFLPVVVGLLFILNLDVIAQDSLQFQSGNWVVGKIIEKRKNEIQFRKKELPDGPDFIFPISDLQQIRSKQYSVPPKFSSKKIKIQPQTFVSSSKNDSFPIPKQSLSIDLGELIYKRFCIQYEYFFIPGKSSLIGTVSISVKNKNTILQGSNLNKNILHFRDLDHFLLGFNALGNSAYLGFGIQNYFPKNSVLSFCLGFRLDAGIFKYRINLKYIQEKNTTLQPPALAYFSNLNTLTDQNGFMIRPSIMLYIRTNVHPRIMTYLGGEFGYTKFFLEKSSNFETASTINFQPKLGIGYMFGKRKMKDPNIK